VRYDLLNSRYQANGSFNPPPGMTRDEMVNQTLVYFDIAYHARRIRVPTWMDMSLNDPINPGPLQLIAYRNLPESETTRYELLGGELLMTPSPGWKHQSVAAALFKQLSHVIDKEGRWRANFHGLEFDPTNLLVFVNALVNDEHGAETAGGGGFWDSLREWVQ